ncbi:PAS domain-containing protein [Rhizobium sp. BK538]|nr:PAS domain-containing protein [Rhizobium sp. BK538]
MTPDTVTAGNSPIEAAKTVENLTGVGWAFDASGRWIYLSPVLQAALGKTPDELNAWWSEGEVAWKQLLYPDDYERVAGEWRHSIHSGQIPQQRWSVESVPFSSIPRRRAGHRRLTLWRWRPAI